MNELIIIILLILCAIGLILGIRFLDNFEIKYTYVSKLFPQGDKYRITGKVTVNTDKGAKWYSGILFVNLDTGQELVMEETKFYDLFITIAQLNSDNLNNKKLN